MVRRASVFVVLSSLCAVVVTAWFSVCGRGRGREFGSALCSPAHASTLDGRVGRSRDRFGDIIPPVELSVTLAGRGSGPIRLLVSVSSSIAAESGVLTLGVPGIGTQPARVEALWAGTPGDLIRETVEYPVGVLPVGRYCFVVILEFMPAGGEAEEITISDSLYLDVTPTAVLASDVSFEQIAHVALRRELERRIARTMRAGLAVAGEELIVGRVARFEDADPGCLERALTELKAAETTWLDGIELPVP